MKLTHSQRGLCSICHRLFLTCSNLAPPRRQRKPQQPAQPEGSLSTRMRQCYFHTCLNMMDSPTSLCKFLSWILLNYLPPLSVIAGERRHRGRRAWSDSDIPDVQHPAEPPHYRRCALRPSGGHGCEWLLGPICQNVGRANNKYTSLLMHAVRFNFAHVQFTDVWSLTWGRRESAKHKSRRGLWTQSLTRFVRELKGKLCS